MKILQINKYHFIKGGAERVFFNTKKLLESQGHEVVCFSMHHPENKPCEYKQYFVSRTKTNNPSFIQGVKSFSRFIYSPEAAQKIEELIKDTKPDVAHVHFFDQLSSTILPVLKKYDIPVVLTTHDYKLICPHYYLNKGGIVCPKNKLIHAAQTVTHKRFKDSYLASGAVSIAWLFNQWRGVYKNNIDRFISPSPFLTQRLSEYGLKKGKIETIPNFINLPEKFSEPKGEYVLFVGRLSAEKGVDVVVKTASLLPDVPFYVAGTGNVEIPDLPNLNYIGYQNKKDLMDVYKNAAMLMFPSKWEEVCPMVLLEAASFGLPVVGSNLGGVKDIVFDGESGILFNPLDSHAEKSACQAVRALWEDEEKRLRMGKKAFELLHIHYCSESFYEKLLEVYSLVSSKR